jgi:hypothetical protein
MEILLACISPGRVGEAVHRRDLRGDQPDALFVSCLNDAKVQKFDEIAATFVGMDAPFENQCEGRVQQGLLCLLIAVLGSFLNRG